MAMVEIDSIRQAVEDQQNRDGWHVLLANLNVCALALPPKKRRYVDLGHGKSFLSLLNEDEVRGIFEVHNSLLVKDSKAPTIARIMKELNMPLFRYSWLERLFEGLLEGSFRDNKEYLPRALALMKFNYPHDVPREELIRGSLNFNFGHGASDIDGLEFVGQPDGRAVRHFSLTPSGSEDALVIARLTVDGYLDRPYLKSGS